MKNKDDPNKTDDSNVKSNPASDNMEVVKIENDLFKIAYFQLRNVVKKLEESEYFFRESQRAAFIGSYYLDYQKDIWKSSEVLDIIFGIHSDYKRSIQSWVDIVHPDYKAEMSSYFEGLISSKNKIFNKDYKIIRRNDKELRWVRGLGALEFNTKGEMVSMSGTIQDITNIKVAQENDKKTSEELRKAQHIAKIGNFSLDLRTNKAILSGELLNIYGLNPNNNAITHEEFLNIIHPDDRQRIKLEIEQAIGSKQLNTETEYKIVLKNGIEKIIRGSSEIVYENGQPITFFGVAQDITERKLLEEAKSGFLSIISHQLNTPLSMTKWVLEVLTDDKDLTPRQREKVNDLNISNERLISLVKRLMNVAHIESGRLIANRVTTDIKKLVENLIEEIKPLAFKKDKIISSHIPEKLDSINCDPLLIHEALENLLTNAIEYSTENSKTIDISIADRVDDYLISVHNAGLIEPMLSEKIRKFDKFSHGGKMSYMQPSGSGLGLYIAKNVVEVNGGMLWFESSAEAGTTFYFTINKIVKLIENNNHNI